MAVPKGRILDELVPVMRKVGIEPENDFFKNDSRKLMFNTNQEDLILIRVRSFDVATFVALGAAQIGVAGDDVLNEFEYKLDDSSLYKELAIYSDKYDISEEIVRINCHLEQFDLYVKTEKYPGKKINFLCQELFREINTIGSKSSSDKISLLVVDFKNSLEKIREQVQNIL